MELSTERSGAGIWLCSGPSYCCGVPSEGNWQGCVAGACHSLLVAERRVPQVAELGEDHEDPVGALELEGDALGGADALRVRTLALQLALQSGVTLGLALLGEVPGLFLDVPPVLVGPRRRGLGDLEGGPVLA